MLTAGVAEGVLANAIWELAIKPLYRGIYTTPSPRQVWTAQNLGPALKKAAKELAETEDGKELSARLWKRFLTSDDARTLLQDLFMFQMDPDAPATEEIAIAFDAVWTEFCGSEGIPRNSVGIRKVFDRLVTTARIVTDAAVEDGVLAAHEAKAVARHRVVEARLDVISGLVQSVIDVRPTVDQVIRFETQLRTEVALRYSKLEPPSILQRERVDIDRLFTPPNLRGRGEAPSSPSMTLPDFIRTLHRRVVLGNPGAGKSTLAAKISHDLATSRQSLLRETQATPWIVQLRRLPADRTRANRSLVDFFTHWAQTSYQLTVPDGAFHWLLLRGRLLVVFDGLDELLDTSLRQDVRDEVESFCRRYATTPVLITSRSVGYDHAPLDPAVFDSFILADFDEPRVATYTRKWFDIRLGDEPAEARTRQVRDFMHDSEVAGELRNNPLLLALLVSLHRGPGSIPNNLPDVYNECASLLFSTWDKHRGIESLLPFADHVRPALRELALWLFETPSLSAGVTRRQAVERTTKYLRRRRFGDPDRARAAAESFVDFCRGRAWVFTDQGSTAAGEDLFGFTHRTFLEFFAGEHLAYRKQTAEELAKELVPRIVQGEWDVVSLIALQIKGRSYPEGADDVIIAVVDNIRRYRGKALADGVQFVLRLLHALIPSPSITRRLGMRLTVFGLREAYRRGGTIDGVKILAAMARVGSEVRDELAAGVVSAQVQLIGSDSADRRRLGSELLFRSSELLPELDTPAVAFWQDTAAAALREHRDDVRRAVEGDVDVARDAWPTWLSTDELLKLHGAPAMFDHRFALSGVPSAEAPIRRLVRQATAGPQSDENFWPHLETVGRYLLTLKRPWLTASHPGVLALAMADVLNLASRPNVKFEAQEALVRFTIWACAATAFEALELLLATPTSEHEAAVRMSTAVNTLRGANDPVFVSLGDILAFRASWDDDRDDLAFAVATQRMTNEMDRLILRWSAGEESLLGRAT